MHFASSDLERSDGRIRRLTVISPKNIPVLEGLAIAGFHRFGEKLDYGRGVDYANLPVDYSQTFDTICTIGTLGHDPRFQSPIND